MRSTRIVIVAGVLLAVTELPTLCPAQSQAGAQWNAETLGVISEFASTNCPAPAMKESDSSLSGSAEVKFDLPTLLKKLTDIGATIKGEAKSSNYNGVTQEKLADALKNSMDCRLKLIELVFDRVLPPPLSAQTDSIEIVQASMTRRGNDAKGFDPSQHYVHGIAHVVYTGKGPYTANFFTACLTNDSQLDATSTCYDNSEFPQPYQGSGPTKLEFGSHTYPFVVYLPGSLQLAKNLTDVQVMVRP